MEERPRVGVVFTGLVLGLTLIAQLTESVEIMSDPGAGTSITMVFVLDT